MYNIEYISGWKFKAVKGVFNRYIDKWGAIKMNSDGAIKQLAKLMLNSLYGKFGTNPNITPKIPYFEDNIVKWKLGEKEYRNPIYIPMAVFITAWARDKTIRTAQKCYDRFIYADTDSLHLIETDIPDDISNIVDDKKLGFWKIENKFTRGRFIRQKTYIEEIDGEIHVTCAGMTDTIKEKITWENFHIGFKSYGKLLPKRVENGIVLKDTEFTIK